MKARAKTINTPCPVWVYGEYTNIPPPHNGKARPYGYYIEKGGCPGADVYEIDIATLCRYTGITDHSGKDIYSHDILLYEKAEEISYIMLLDETQAVDIVTGEIMEIKDLTREDIKVTGNLFDNPGFIPGIRHIAEEGLDMPYLPELNVTSTGLPFLKLTCLECGYATFASRYMLACSKCGGYYLPGYATEISREKSICTE